MTIEFDCVGCKTHVISFAADVIPETGRCFTCTFLDETIPDPVEREKVRRHINKEMHIDGT